MSEIEYKLIKEAVSRMSDDEAREWFDKVYHGYIWHEIDEEYYQQAYKIFVSVK